MILALLYLTSSHDEFGTRSWKGFDRGAMDRLYAKGYISDPNGKSSSLILSEEGAALSKEMFNQYCGAIE
jgi:hypothetical protein